MKKRYTLVALSFLLSTATFSFAQSDYGCKKKENNLQTQLLYAEQNGNIHRAENLKRALINVREHCGKADYIEDQDLKLNDEIYKQNLNEKIKSQQEKVTKAEEELNRAKATGKDKKIRDKTEKLEKRQDKLNHYLNELKSL